jgi:hypothetical protein
MLWWKELFKKLVKIFFLALGKAAENLLEEDGMPNALQVDEFASGVVDTAGVPLAGGKVYTYAAGTTSDKATYTDSAMTTSETNPIILDAAGCKNVYAYGNYKFVIKTAAGVTVRTLDNQYYMIPSTTSEVVNSIAFADSPYSATAANQLIKVNVAGGAVTIYLPTAVGNEGIEIIVMKISADANAVTVDSNTLFSQDINGANSASLGTDQYSFMGFISDNANWFVSQNVNTATVTSTSSTTMTNKTLTAPVINGTVTGTYTLGGTPTITTPTITVEAWKNFTPAAGWTPVLQCSYMKDPMGFVHMTGGATTTNTTTYSSFYSTLDAGYRPEQNLRFAAFHTVAGTMFYLTIATTGAMTVSTSASAGIVLLDGITFKAA